MCNCDEAVENAGNYPDADCEENEETCPLEERIDIRLVDDGGNPTTESPTVKNVLEISNRVTTDELPGAFATASADRDNFKVDVLDAQQGGSTIDSSKVELEVLKADGSSFNPRRTLSVECRRVGSTDWFRSKYIRLVTDGVDQAASASQTLLTDWDAANPDNEILDQRIRSVYNKGGGQSASAEASVGSNRRKIDVAVHVMRQAPGGAGVVTTAQATTRIQKWFRRVYAQVGMAPCMVEETRYIDPLENLISISDNTGADAAGGGANGVSFDIRVRPSVGNEHVYSIGPHTPSAGDSAMTTANAIADLINNDFSIPVTARTVQNPPTLEGAINKGSADIILREVAGERVIIENLTSDDASQTVSVGRVTPTNFVGWAAGNPVPLNWVAGSIQQRTVLQDCDTGSDRIDIVVIDTFSSGDRGQAMMPGTIYAAGKQAISQITMSAFVASRTMDGTDNNPFSCPHEAGHVMLDAIHAQENTQLMRSGTSANNQLNGSKRFSESGVNFDNPSQSIVQETRIRNQGSSVLSGW